MAIPLVVWAGAAVVGGLIVRKVQKDPALRKDLGRLLGDAAEAADHAVEVDNLLRMDEPVGLPYLDQLVPSAVDAGWYDSLERALRSASTDPASTTDRRRRADAYLRHAGRVRAGLPAADVADTDVPATGTTP